MPTPSLNRAEAVRRNLLSLVWTRQPTPTELQEGHPVPVVPLDFPVYDLDANENGKHHTKNDHFQAVVSAAKARGLRPQCVAFDSWCAGLSNPKHVREEGFFFLTRLKSNRLVNPDKSGLVELASLSIAPQGQEVWLKGFGLVRLFASVDAQGQIQFWATSDLEMDANQWRSFAKACWGIESYHHVLKGCCGVEHVQVRSSTGQKKPSHAGLARLCATQSQTPPNPTRLV